MTDAIGIGPAGSVLQFTFSPAGQSHATREADGRPSRADGGPVRRVDPPVSGTGTMYR